MSTSWLADGSICPICGGPGRKSARHPGAICQQCQAAVVDSDGILAILSNQGFSGGLEVTVGDRTIRSPEAESFPLYADGVECRAREYRFGGVVVQPLRVWAALDDNRN